MVVRWIALVCLGVVAHLALYLGFSWLDEPSSDLSQLASPWWIVAQGPISAAIQVLPALAVAFLAKRHGWLLGAITAGAGWTVAALLQEAPYSIGGGAFFASRVLGEAVMGAVAGMAGQWFAGTPSNNSSKPTPLRGAA
jgi:hypothetical protein